jgi:hypothetical protein
MGSLYYIMAQVKWIRESTICIIMLENSNQKNFTGSSDER